MFPSLFAGKQILLSIQTPLESRTQVRLVLHRIEANFNYFDAELRAVDSICSPS